MPISAALERELRECGPGSSAEGLVQDIIALIDAERARAEKKVPGLGYKAIVAGLRVGLGDRLAVPSNPSTAWIVRQVNRARELGLDVEQIEQLGHCAAKAFRTGPVEAEYVLRAAVRLLQQGPEVVGDGRRLVVGRPDPED